MTSEVAGKADFTDVRYAQCWEDADILLEALQIQPGDQCLAIASAGDNALAMLTRDPSRVTAIDLNPSQLACLELRVAAFRVLEHAQLLELIGSRPSRHRREWYRRCRPHLSPAARKFWDGQPAAIAGGVGGAGKFERYFAIFRRWVLPLVHCRATIDRLVQGGTLAERERFYRRGWDSWRWRLMFRLFFSRWVMGRLGRDPAFFTYVEGSVADRILERTRHALTQLNPAENPYLQWILKGRHLNALPLPLRPENFAAIRDRLDRLEWRCQSVEDYLKCAGRGVIDRFNLSDIFEYMSESAAEALLAKLADAGRPGGRLVYWNMLAQRGRPEALASRLRPLDGLARQLHLQDKAFFYSRLVIEEII